jgi:hypothetical protein
LSPFIEQLDILEPIVDFEWRWKLHSDSNNQMVSGTSLERYATRSKARAECDIVNGKRGWDREFECG